MKAIVAAWDAGGLDAKFKALWPDPTSAEFVVLHDQEASPKQPLPYCVLNQLTGRTICRMSGGANKVREVRDHQFSFNVQATEVAGDSRSSKQVAAYLAEEIMKVFGGHPTDAASALTLDNGNALLSEYQTDYGVRIDEFDDNRFTWVVSYVVRVDVPVMA